MALELGNPVFSANCVWNGWRWHHRCYVPSKRAVLQADPQHFIFGKKQAPGEAMPYRSTFWERNVKVLKELNYTDRPYDIYSYKHSGAISLYRATKDIKLVQRQCRHQSIEQTNTYLRDLGLLDDHQALKHWKGFAE